MQKNGDNCDVIDLTERDYCKSSPCENEGVCNNTATGHTCSCKNVYIGYNCDREYGITQCVSY